MKILQPTFLSKRIFSCCMLFLFFSFLQAQDFSSRPPSESYIKSNPNIYLWGEGTGKNLRQADKRALAALVDQISVSVSSSFENTKMVEEGSGEVQEYSKSVINTYSSVSLQGAEKIVLSQQSGKYKVLRYISKSEIQKIFEKRKEKIFSLLSTAQGAERDWRIGESLKNYYWALVLLQTHPDHDKVQYKQRLLKIWLNDKIESLLSGIKFNISEIKKMEDASGEYLQLTLHFTYESQPVENLDFGFWNGQGYTKNHGVKDGIGAIEVHGLTSKLKVKIEYHYDQEVDKELESAMAQDYLPDFSRRSELPPSSIEVSKSSKSSYPRVDMLSQKEVRAIKDLLQSVSTKKNFDIQEVATPNGAAVYQKLLKYGNAKLLTPKKVETYDLDQRKITRAFPMSFDFPNNNKRFVESVVLAKDAEGKVQDFSFALSQRPYKDIMAKDKWDERQRRLLIDFIEHYKTSYALRRVDYLEQVFSEDALIIVGSRLKKAKPNKDFAQSPLKEVRYKKLSKKQFISRLRRVFAQKDYVNIRFGATRFRASKVPGVYGVNIEQNYYSSNYADKGHLFLVVDLRKEDQPRIHVRTWLSPEDLKERGGEQFKLSEFF